jgi:hypothetical protein
MRMVLLICFTGFFVASLAYMIATKPRARETSATAKCLNNLRQIDAAKQQWAADHKSQTDRVLSWEDIRLYVGIRGNREFPPRCQLGGSYTIGRATDEPTCSIGGRGHTLNFDPETEDREHRNRVIGMIVCGCSAGLALITIFTGTKRAATVAALLGIIVSGAGCAAGRGPQSDLSKDVSIAMTAKSEVKREAAPDSAVTARKGDFLPNRLALHRGGYELLVLSI